MTFRRGDSVSIVNQTSVYCGQVGTLVEEKRRGGWDILLHNGATVYIPYGWKRAERRGRKGKEEERR